MWSPYLQPGGKQEVTVWAYPKQPGAYTDTLLMNVANNPEEFQIEFQCTGIKPEIQIDRKVMQFEKVLLHRKTSQTLQLYNPTALPIAWRVAGMENIGDEFSLNSEFGVLDPYQTFVIEMNFR